VPLATFLRSLCATDSPPTATQARDLSFSRAPSQACSPPFPWGAGCRFRGAQPAPFGI